MRGTGALATVAVLAAVAATACGNAGTAKAEAEPVLDVDGVAVTRVDGRMIAYASVYAWLRYPQDREITAVTVAPVKMVDEPDLWSERYDDYYPKPDPYPVAAGTRFQLVVDIQPDCDDPSPIPVVTVTSRTKDGTTLHDDYQPKDAEAYLQTVSEYCDWKPPPRPVGAGAVSAANLQQALYVVTAWRRNGEYSECMEKRGHDVPWQGTINLAEGLRDDPALVKLYEKTRQTEGDEEPEWNTRAFQDDMRECRRLGPERGVVCCYERVKDWTRILEEARQHGWSPDDPLASD